jgi:hypothetical protein
MNQPPIVTWTTPVQNAERTLRGVADELELGSREKAQQLIREHLAHIRALVQFLDANPQAGRRP